jgi:hypothetical protein
MVNMGFFNLQKKLLKKTFVFNNYVWKSGLLDLLCFFLFFIMFIFVVGQMNYYTYESTVYEENYNALMGEESISETFKLDVAKSYLDSLNTLIFVVIISLAILVLISFIFGSFIKIIQYKHLNKRLYYKKGYFKLVLATIRNTLPLFLIVWGVIFLLPILFGFTILTIIIMSILFLFYTFALPALRICSYHFKSFKLSWKKFFSLLKIRTAINYSLTIKTFVLLTLIILFLINLINGLFSNTLVNSIIGGLTILFIIFAFVFLRKYLYYSLNLVFKSEELGDQKKKK